MPSGPGVIAETLIAEIAAAVPPAVGTFLLTSEVEPAAIVAQQRRCGVNTIQLCDAPHGSAYPALREALPGIALVQVIHVRGESAVAEAARIAPLVDGLLLDSGNPTGPVKELGGTGRVHDWALSPAFSPWSWSARRFPADRVGKARSAGASGKRLDARCRPESAALRVAPRRPPAASRTSTVVPATLFGSLLADRTPGRDADRDHGEKSGLAGASWPRPPARCFSPAGSTPAMRPTRSARCAPTVSISARACGGTAPSTPPGSPPSWARSPRRTLSAQTRSAQTRAVRGRSAIRCLRCRTCGAPRRSTPRRSPGWRISRSCSLRR